MDETYMVYILQSSTTGRYYTGFTNDLDRRLAEHNRKKGKYTDAGQPWVIAYTEEYDSKIDAQTREKFIKSRKSKSFIEELISSKER